MAYNGSGAFAIDSTGQPVVDGTLIDANVFNDLTADLAGGLSTAICKDGQTVITNDIPMSFHKITGLAAADARTDAASLATIQDGKGIYVAAVDGSTLNLIALTASPPIASYVAGQIFRFISPWTNTSSVLVIVNGGFGEHIKKLDGQFLDAGDIRSGMMVEIVYNGTDFYIMNPATQTAIYVSTVGGTANAITLSPDSPIVDYVAGQMFMFLAANTNTGDTTIAVSGLTATAVQKTGQSGPTILGPGDIKSGGLIVVVYDGTSFNIISPSYPQEVSWTPTVGGNATYTVQTGKAFRSGMMVHLEVSLTINVIGTGSTTQVTGVPFSAYSVATAAVLWTTSSTAVVAMTAVLTGSTITLYSVAAAGASLSSSNAIFKAGTVIKFSMDYLTTD